MTDDPTPDPDEGGDTDPDVRNDPVPNEPDEDTQENKE